MAVAILLSTCRFVLLSRPGDLTITRMALQYKQMSLHALRLEVERRPSGVNFMSVAKSLALAIDEVRMLSAWLLQVLPDVQDQQLMCSISGDYWRRRHCSEAFRRCACYGSIQRWATVTWVDGFAGEDVRQIYDSIECHRR